VPREALAATGERASLIYLKDACARLDNQVRAPPTDQLVKAWTTFVREKCLRKGKFSDVEAVYTRRIFELLKETEKERFQQLISDESISEAMDCIDTADNSVVEPAAAQAFVALSEALFNEADTRGRDDASSADRTEGTEPQQIAYKNLWLKHLASLTRHGRAEEARDAITASKLSHKAIESAWKGFLRHLCLVGSP
jgi:hypothetical protein